MVDLLYLIQISDLDKANKREAFQNYYHATPDELDILYGIFEIPATWRFVGEFFRGAHARIVDKGGRYADWKTLPSADIRHSSHHSDGPQYHVDGFLVHTALFGKLGNCTWVQLERHPLYDVVNIVGHVIDWIDYKFTNENQGPYGSSGHTEGNQPIVIVPTQPYLPRRPRAPGCFDAPGCSW